MVTDGSGEVGAAKLTNEVLMIMSSVPSTVKNMTGVDITQQLSRSGLTGSRVIYSDLNLYTTFFKYITSSPI